MTAIIAGHFPMNRARPAPRPSARPVIRLGRRHLFEDLPRFFASLGGIVFAVQLVLVQVGIYVGFVHSSSLLIRESRADFWVAAKEMQYLEITLPVPYSWIAKARAVDGVAAAEPIIIRSIIFENDVGALDYGRVVGFDPAGSLVHIDDRPVGDLREIAKAGAFAADVSQLSSLGLTGIGGEGSIRSKKARLVALVHNTQPTVSPTFLYTSLRNAVLWSPITVDEFVRDPLVTSFDVNSPLNFLLVKAQPGADLAKLQMALEHALPNSRVLPKAEMMAVTERYWIKRTNVGFILGLCAVLGILVGVVVVAQILYTSVNEHVREYGTVKALGIPDRLLYASIVTQAVAMAVIGFFPGLLLGLAISDYAQNVRGVAISITLPIVLEVLGLSIAMCVIAAIFAVRRAMTIDPMIVFKS